MSTGTSSQHEQTADLREQAALWFMRLRDPDVTPEVIARAEVWRAEDPEHEAAYRSVQAAWAVVGENAAAPEMVIARRDALKRAGKAARSRWGQQGWRRMAIAATVLLTSAVGFMAWQLLPGQFFSGKGDGLVYETAFGETRVITLSDNSRLALDTETRVLVTYTGKIREIDLIKGQAHFDVAKDPSRPFQVIADGQNIRALGTAFNVEMIADQLRVTLLEGRIAVQSKVQSPKSKVQNSKPGILDGYRELSPGQQIVVTSTGAIEMNSAANLDAVEGWRRGKLIFEGEPLSLALERVNKYSRTKVSVQNQTLESLPISGVFDTGDTQAFVEALTQYFPIKATNFGPETIWLTGVDSGE